MLLSGCSSLPAWLQWGRNAASSLPVPATPAVTNAPATPVPAPEPDPEPATPAPAFSIQSVTVDWGTSTITPVNLVGTPGRAQIAANRHGAWPIIDWPDWTGTNWTMLGPPGSGERAFFELLNDAGKAVFKQEISR